MKKMALIGVFLFSVIGASAQGEMDFIVIEILQTPQVQKLFSGKRYYQIMANDVINETNCDVSQLRLDKRVRFWKNEETFTDGRQMIEPTDCIVFLSILIEDNGGYRVLIQDLNTGRNLFLQEY